MVRTLMVSMYLALAAGVLQAQAAAEAAVLRLDSLWAHNYQVHDTANAERLMDPAIVIVSSNGTIKTRETEMGDIRPAPGLKMDYFRTKDVSVKVHGSTAYVAGIAEWSFEYNGRTSQIARRYTAAYAQGGPLGWRMVGLHLASAPAGR